MSSLTEMTHMELCVAPMCKAAASSAAASNRPPMPSPCAGTFSRQTNHTQKARVYSHVRPIRRSKHGYILTTDQSDTINA
eukprot:5464413-Pyramimonas_sp.AAC.1